jgi:DNA (cytosine-5)-methyltransferase 1
MVNVVSTFAGCGGSSLGYKRAGCDVLLAIDFEENATVTYKMNFPKTIVWKKNIRDITGESILNAIGLKKGELDIFDGSPPCTPFSTSGKRDKGWNIEYKHSSETTSQRADDLFFEYIRLIDELQPKTFIGENVKGMIIGNAKGYFNDILSKMREIGYTVHVLNINAKDYEVPQSRPRIVFIGIRNDIKISDAKLLSYPQISFNDAVKDLPKSNDSELKYSTIDPTTKTYKILQATKPGQSCGKVHPNGSFFNTIKIHPSKPIPTITTKMQLAHHIEPRWLTVSEIKRCASFPDNFKFISNSDAWVRIGNSVPPNLIKNVALYLQKLVNFNNKLPLENKLEVQ